MLTPPATEIRQLLVSIFDGLFDTGTVVNFERGALEMPGCSATVPVDGAWQADVWVALSPTLAARISEHMFGGSSAGGPIESAEATRELANIVAGNLKALFPAPSFIGTPRSLVVPPASTLDSSNRVELSVDGEPLFVWVQRRPIVA